MDNQLFRKKTIDRISSPEQLHDYMRVTSPRLWMILSAIIVLLVGFAVYAATAQMESTEKVILRKFDFNNASARIPAGREDLIKIDMEVRAEGHTGRIVQIDNSTEYILNVSFDGEAPTEDSYYMVSIGEDRDIQTSDGSGYDYENLIFVYFEDGCYYLLDNQNEKDDAFEGNDVRVRFWTEDYSGETPVLRGGLLATVHDVVKTVTTTAYVRMDEAEGALAEGVYEAEIITETTTPIRFLLN